MALPRRGPRRPTAPPAVLEALSHHPFPPPSQDLIRRIVWRHTLGCGRLMCAGTGGPSVLWRD
eukprot:scaffold794_cov113-Isochrysis_galbana.AAC.1